MFARALAQLPRDRQAELFRLTHRRFNAAGYDPHEPFGFADAPNGKYDYVFLVFLMTRLKNDANRRTALAKASEYVRPGGQLVLVSRNLTCSSTPAFPMPA